MTNDPRNAIIYVRISRDKVGAGLGVQRQQQDCEELARRLGWRVVAVYADNDLSAYSGKPRPGYRKLLEDLRAGKATAVLAWHTDRLHRSPIELEEYINACDPMGTVTHTVKAGHLDLATPSGRMVARQLGAVARFESEHRADRQRRKRQQMAESGQWKGGRRPYGYEVDGITVRESEAIEVRRAVEELLSGATLGTVARAMTARGATTSTGKPWAPRELSVMLKRPRNAGIMEHQGEEFGRASWAPIVQEETWRAVVALLNDPRRRTTPGPTRRWLGSGLYECGVCVEAGEAKAALICTTSGGHAGTPSKPSYRCAAKRNHVTRYALHLDKYVGRIVVERLSQPDAVNMVHGLTAGDTGGQERALERDAIRVRESEAAVLFASGAISAAQLATMNASWSERRAELDRLDMASARVTALAPFRDGDAAEVWERLDLDRRRAVVAELMWVIVLPLASAGRPKGWTPEYGKEWGYFDPNAIRIEWR